MYERIGSKVDCKQFLEIARDYKNGTNGVGVNFGESIRWYDIAIECGSAWARIELISLLMDSQFRTEQYRSYIMAQRIYENENDVHWTEAAIRLARINRKGIGVDPDYKESSRIYAELIGKGNDSIQKEYIEFIYSKPDAIHSIEDVQCIIDIDKENGYSGKTKAILSRIYKSGQFVDKDLSIAINYAKAAIKEGNEWSKIELVTMLMGGNPIQQKEAVKTAHTYEKEMTGRLLYIVYEKLGIMYRKGIGVNVDEGLASKYERLFKNNGVHE